MRGIQALFVRRDEVEEAWKWVDSITGAWASDNDAPKPSGWHLGAGGFRGDDHSDGRSWNEFDLATR
jgi:glucose-6-phosphate 1-dehydrogenase